MISSPVSVGLHTRQLRFWLLEKFWFLIVCQFSTEIESSVLCE
ncbi:hypothetical protein SLEP1_g4812 [Rubroshorea leprosula]|uniref:Uncharacterized protein n=1 Tax=Rubroshorea leprosula TaxID=152421 RepID=A0AAV5HYR2_9ROSI|nr:hypothetical protein SLEP1_g4812 [Rubroshorea leprosula]